MINNIKKDKTIKCVFGSRYLTGKLKSNKNYYQNFKQNVYYNLES